MVLHAIYASTSGNTELVIETIAEIGQQQGVEVQLHRSEQTSIDVITQNDTFLLATSTWEHGVVNPFFDRLIAEIKKTSCAGKRACFVGLGDIRYEQVMFCYGIEELRTLWKAQGGEEFHKCLKINGEPHHQLASMVDPWAIACFEELKKIGQPAGA